MSTPVSACTMWRYGVATVSRIDKIIGLFCRILSLLWGSFAKEAYDLIDPTNRIRLIYTSIFMYVYVCVCMCVGIPIYIPCRT